ncbi:MAG: type IV toxin-antitoxin system AbiEi family antitoxin domain-containing protein [Caldilineaceae bacterium]|nr:type IV toxin-antitoxin system AbiEi family antitoxin domain-containing protein [Caldilineaceae bacterium]
MSDALTVLRELNRPVRTAEAARLGIKPAALYALAARGEVERYARGVFVLADRTILARPDLTIVGLRSPRAVVCLTTALWFHDLGTQPPRTISVAVRRGDHRPNAAWPPLRVHSFSPRSYASGIETHVFDGVEVKVYSREKTLADCFKFRHQVGMDVVLEALHDYAAGPRDMDELARQVRICRVDNVMRPYLETALWTAGG